MQSVQIRLMFLDCFILSSSIVLQQKCPQKVVPWLLFCSPRKSLASKCTEDPACPVELIGYVGMWGRPWSYSCLCSPCTTPFLDMLTNPNFYWPFINSNNISFQVMQELGLIGLRIQRMPSEPNLEFGIPSQYSYMTVCLYPLQYYTRIHFRI